MAWEQAKIDGQIYMVPNYANEFGQEVLAVRGDLMENTVWMILHPGMT